MTGLYYYGARYYDPRTSIWLSVDPLATYNPFQISTLNDENYRTEGNAANDLTRKNHAYQYDANGNLIYVNTSREKKDGTLQEKNNERKLLWNEENRLQAIDDNGFVSNYWYDAAGERTVKTSGESQQMYVNSVFSGGDTQTANFTAYVNPYLVVSKGGSYTKHIYIGSQRIVSKLGDLDSYGSDPRRIEYAGANVDGAKVDYKTKYTALQQTIKDRYAKFEVPYYGKDNDDYVNGQGFCCDNTPNLKSFNPSQNDNPELFQYYYHSDHLGSSSLITNLDGDIVQHIEYVPFGEVFIEERNNTWNTPYLFNAKELDEETGLYYYGARYYDPREGIFLSVDQMVEKTGTPYQYCYQNPVRYTDPTGMVPGDGDGGGNERILPRTEPLKHGGSWYRNVGVFAHNALASFTNVVYDVGESLIQESIFIYNNGVGAYLSNFGNSISNSVSSTYNYIVDTPVKEILKNEWSALKRDIADPYAWSDAIGKTAWMLTPMKVTGGTRALVPTIETPSMMIGPPASKLGGRLGNAATRNQIDQISTILESRGYKIEFGGQRGFKEEFLKPLGGGRSGGSYLDITATHPKYGTLRINTVDTYSSGLPTFRELNNAARIRQQIKPGEHLLLIPKTK